MTRWIVTKHEGGLEADEWELPGELREAEVEEIVRRLVCRSLSEDEIIHASLPEDHSGRYVLLDRSDEPTMIQIGRNPYFIARLVD